MRIDLHTHSSVSDGTDAPADLVAKASSVGLDVIALTDHDTFDGLGAARRAGERVGVRVVGGLEMSAERAGASVHVLGYGCDPGDAALLEALARLRAGRDGRLPAMLARLAELGMPLSAEAVARHAGPAVSLGRPHVADAMVEAGYVADRTEAFDRWLAEDKPAYVTRYACPVPQAIDLIHAAGGVAVIAHPWGRGRRGTLPEDLLTRWVRDHGLDGVEVDHPDHDTATRADLRAWASRLGALTTGSSDHHGLGKTNNDLGCETTDEAVFDDLLARIDRRGGRP